MGFLDDLCFLKPKTDRLTAHEMKKDMVEDMTCWYLRWGTPVD